MAVKDSYCGLEGDLWDAIQLSFFLVSMITEIVFYKQLIEYGLNLRSFSLCRGAVDELGW